MWLDRLKLGKRRSVQHPVNGVVHNFYAVSPSTILKLREIGIPLSEAISKMISAWAGRDGNFEERNTSTEDGSYGSEVIHHAASPDVMNARFLHRTEAIDSLATSLLTQEVERFLYSVIMDSMRDVFDRKSDSSPEDNWPTPEEFGRTVTIDDLYEMLQGVYEANKKVMSPLAGILEAMKGMFQDNTMIPSQHTETQTGSEQEESTQTEDKEPPQTS